jgi:16S rRNA (uracil1498-N3)-methyltransferase
MVMIGPEGDFTDEEVRLASDAGFLPVHLGASRLRTETAGVAACCSVYLANI